MDNRAANASAAAGRAHTRPLVAISLYYLLFFGAMGCLAPFISLYYKKIGLSGAQIGMLMAIAPLVMPFISVIWGMLSDSLLARWNTLAIATLGAVVPALLLSTTHSLPLLAAFTLALALFAGAPAPLVDTVALEVAEASERSYGGLRLWGSIGYVAAAYGLGVITERTGLRSLFYGYAALMAISFFVALRLPARKHRWTGPGLPGLRLLLRDRTLIIFLASVFFLASAVAVSERFFGLYVNDIGGTESLLGLAVAIAALSEVPVMLVSGRLARRLTAKGLYILGFAVYVLRFFLYAVIRTPQLILLVQALHGLSYATYFVGGVIYTNERAPAGLSATAQALFSSTAYGVGSVAGSLVGGYLYDRVGMANLFLLCSLVTGLALVAFLLVPTSRERVAET